MELCDCNGTVVMNDIRNDIQDGSSDANCNHKDNTEMPKKSTDYGLLTILIMIQRRYSNMHYGNCIHAIKYGRNELAHVKVKTNLDCHSREEHVQGHRGETIPEDENSRESYFDCHHKRLHVC